MLAFAALYRSCSNVLEPIDIVLDNAAQQPGLGLINARHLSS
jgi:hypothetical protein